MYQNQSSTLNVGRSNVNNWPIAHITVNRNRLRLYDSNVYLKNGSTFEIELWNPKTTRVLAKIMINGVNVSSGGIVVNPGQRVYLERFLDVDHKFLFNTYEIENSVEAVEAAQLNGLVKIEFFDEQVVYPGCHTTQWIYGARTITISPPQPLYRNDYFFGTTNTGGVSGSGSSFTTNNANASMTGDLNVSNYMNNASLSCSNNVSQDSLNFCDSFSDDSPRGPKVRSKLSKSSLETGRIEQGGKSDQQLVDTYGSFNSWACNTYSYRILPESTKPIEVGEVRRKCPNCGAKVKSHWKACPICSTKLTA